MNIKIGQIYKITYPNGKIYIGQDRTNDINYFGSANSELIADDFHGWAKGAFTVTKEILIEHHDITIKELNALEREMIARFDSDNPMIGYNRTKRKK